MQDPATPPLARVLQQPEQSGTLQDLAEAAEQEHNEQRQLEQQHLSLASLQDTLAQTPARVKTCDLRQAAIIDEAGALRWPRCVAGRCPCVDEVLEQCLSQLDAHLWQLSQPSFPPQQGVTDAAATHRTLSDGSFTTMGKPTPLLPTCRRLQMDITCQASLEQQAGAHGREAASLSSAAVQCNSLLHFPWIKAVNHVLA